ncbi:MAG: DNA polymerase/3'-5' exonuclease PolX [Candidatus Jettenia sp.]|uniref:DNA polymerase beta n=1 Tax=Candidatus Jettenia caeni TaxID=247490 RepID=I3IL82_9BACT|nr:DNA polymerase/3'-5' exonuclease PolX [Candidatus Jettenia sp. AMX1]MBC6927623.1 DNA polymerase/3'-5' exonuclease PolX [Candidatus Jettenia sp.]NUN22060.1 DNA polymerase/3'-5' exonuclease PolX [Candidatus Jettenia caeni]KAA0250104.1 MAG: DNA polymerase/3'-5' exonuclease PolX [Candidatus Jettenia sp. AMX1]MCE7880188.1 DNA polymerase/3'-5' exonuclease PolX [Candidatus Jettenia sp. AMX1]MCQ3926628.1 DNA polymerase/3'-5' exonuclease PolX [Candidatus Jettenia sp.]
MKNHEIAALFERIANVLELKGENAFRINSYRKAARILGDVTEDIEVLAREGKLKDIPGIGEGMAEKIMEYIHTGKMSKYDEVMKEISEETITLMQIPGLGPKTVAMLNKKLGIVSLSDLEKALQEGKLKGLFGMGDKKIQNIMRGIELFKTSQQRIPIGMAYPVVKGIIEVLKHHSQTRDIQSAGSLRRMKETVGDIDILATGTHGEDIVKSFVTMRGVTQILAAGDTKGSVRVEEGVQVDLRVVREDEFGSALQYFTGSKEHNVHLREIAKKKGYKISEYGIFKDNKKIGGSREEEIYKVLGMDWIPPELRENKGEIEAAQEGKLPNLIKLSDIKGDLHNHSDWSDGNSTFEEMAKRAMDMGYRYLVVSDHSQSLHVANGLREEELLEEIEEIDNLNKKLKGFTLLKATEVDIMADGSIDFPDKLLEKLDVVIASIHSGFKQEKKKITERMIAAIRNPYVNIIAHPTGRLIGKREGYEIDLDKVMEACVETGTALELNCYYDRLDLNDSNCKKAKETGVMIAISTDAHHVDQMWMIELGVGIARRGWLEAKNVINTFLLHDLKAFCKKKRAAI